MPSGIFTLKQQVLAIREGGWPGQKPLAVDYLVVAGGGGAGASGPGGGGAGGVLLGNIGVTAGSAITVTIGGGGSGTSGTSAPGSGTSSVFGSIAATGGGKGENNSVAASSGGSGGGTGGGSLGPGQGTAGQGNRGGSTYVGGGGGASSGGGGAGNVGESPVVYNAGGAGGPGVGSYLIGALTGYGGGGAGSTGDTGTGTSVPAAAYGGGGTAASGNGGSGQANTGGGGSAAPSYTGGSGGSGIVILSYPDIYAAAASTTGSPTVSTSGTGSILLNGTNQWVYAGTSSDYSFGTGDFTMECWYYLTSLPSNGYIIDLGNPNGTRLQVFSNQLYFIPQSGTNIITSAGVGTATGTWYHVAAVRASNTVTLYLNGAVIGSNTNTNNFTDVFCTIGSTGSNTGTNLFPGYITNVRIVKGTAVYTSAFTTPTAPLTAVTNTRLLLSSVSGAFLADSSGTTKTISVGGTPTWNQLSPFATGLGYKNRVYTWTSSGSITF
jgi:hypothetical protein